MKEQSQQKWEPHWSLSAVYRVWMAVFSAVKIALGAVATVLLIGIVCAFVFVGVLGDYLEEDILPSAGLVLENYDMEETSFLYYVDEDGQIKQLQQIYADTVSKRASFEDIPENLIHAAVAREDKRVTRALTGLLPSRPWPICSLATRRWAAPVSPSS